ncbi:MAG TPA: YbhB/YbcL family Raf kinase inhibitor-like protein [Longimicrobiales bacterium]|nr:YbhB/YbcL family Raf kinase inhibitor-like protein [Longimicrobiales bacterium]
MRIRSAAFENDAPIPVRHTCDGEDISPALRFEDIPDGAASLALIVDDPDAPAKVWVHWLLWGLPADMVELPEDVPKTRIVEGLGGLRQGTTDFDRVGYGGPCPPPGHGTHHYRFTLHALDRRIDLDAGATREELERRLKGRVLAEARLVGTYARWTRDP